MSSSYIRARAGRSNLTPQFLEYHMAKRFELVYDTQSNVAGDQFLDCSAKE